MIAMTQNGYEMTNWREAVISSGLDGCHNEILRKGFWAIRDEGSTTYTGAIEGAEAFGWRIVPRGQAAGTGLVARAYGWPAKLWLAQTKNKTGEPVERRAHLPQVFIPGQPLMPRIHDSFRRSQPDTPDLEDHGIDGRVRVNQEQICVIYFLKLERYYHIAYLWKLIATEFS